MRNLSQDYLRHISMTSRANFNAAVIKSADTPVFKHQLLMVTIEVLSSRWFSIHQLRLNFSNEVLVVTGRKSERLHGHSDVKEIGTIQRLLRFNGSESECHNEFVTGTYRPTHTAPSQQLGMKMSLWIRHLNTPTDPGYFIFSDQFRHLALLLVVGSCCAAGPPAVLYGALLLYLAS